MAHWSDPIYFPPGGLALTTDVLVGLRAGKNFSWRVSDLLSAAGSVGNNAFWVDPATGSDGSRGTMLSPFRTVAHAIDRLGSNGGIIYLAPGAIIKEPDPDLTTLGYQGIAIIGDPGVPAIWLGLDNVTGAWSKTGGFTNIYQISVTHAWSSTAKRGYPGLIDNNIRTYMVYTGTAALPTVTDAASAKAFVDANPGTFYCSPDTWLTGFAAGTYTYYVNTYDSSNPGANGRTYRFANRKYPDMGRQNMIQNVTCISGYEHGGLVLNRGYMNNVGLVWPAAHGAELPGCETDGTWGYVAPKYAYTSIFLHHFGTADKAFALAWHRNPRLEHWRGQFTSAVNVHSDDVITSFAKLIRLDGLRCDDVSNVFSGEQCDMIHARSPVLLNVGALGSGILCNYMIEKPIIHAYANEFDAGVISPPVQAGLTLTIEDIQLTAETISIGNRTAGNGAVVINRGVICQVGVSLQNAWARIIDSCDGFTINDVAISAQVGAPNAQLACVSAGGATATVVQFNRCTIDPSINVPSTWLAGTGNIRTRPMVIEYGDDGVQLDGINTPHRFRSRVVKNINAPFSTLGPNDFLTLTNVDIVHSAVGNGSFAGSSVYTPPTPPNFLLYAGPDGTDNFIAPGNGGVMYQGKVTVGSWAAVTTGLTKNWLCASSNPTAGAGQCLLCADDGSVYYYDQTGPTFTARTSGIATAIRGAFYVSGWDTLVGDAGKILFTSNRGVSFTAVAGTTGTDVLRAVVARAGGPRHWVAVGDDGSGQGIIYYSGDDWTTKLRTAVAPIIFTSIAYNSVTDSFLATGTPGFGKASAYTATMTNAAAGLWTAVATPVDNIVSCAFRVRYTIAGVQMALWAITGPAYRIFYSRDLTEWIPDNPFVPYTIPNRTYADDSLVKALMTTF